MTSLSGEPESNSLAREEGRIVMTAPEFSRRGKKKGGVTQTAKDNTAAFIDKYVLLRPRRARREEKEGKRG